MIFFFMPAIENLLVFVCSIHPQDVNIVWILKDENDFTPVCFSLTYLAL
jgi:hypothetical protein